MKTLATSNKSNRFYSIFGLIFGFFLTNEKKTGFFIDSIQTKYY